MSDLKNKRIISVTTTGAWPKKENNPNVPLQPEEIAEEIYQCWKIGAAVAHVHVRDEQGSDSMKVETFQKVIDLLHGNHPDCDIILNLTSAGGHIRVGMEDNVVYKKGVLAESNMQLIARARRVIEEFGCEAATPDEARQLLSLK